ncbi:MAG: glutamate--tRNA ligase, partial [Firmicutes bacterium]|nr:glutamate--tRNA ligase [Bacillota bacterium]
GWAPSENREIYTLDELVKAFDIKGLSKSPSIFDIVKLTWMNGEYIKKLDSEKFYEMALPKLKEAIKRDDIDLKKTAGYVQTRIGTFEDIAKLVDFIDKLPEYSTELYVHKKMKTTEEISLKSLTEILPVIENITQWNNENIYNAMLEKIKEMEIKNVQMFWPVRTALSGEPASPCGASELAELLGKEDTIKRIKKGIELLGGQAD